MGAIVQRAELWALAAALTMLAGAAVAAPAETLTDADRKALVEIGTAVEAENCDAILKRAVPLVERRERALPQDLAATLYEMIASCHSDAKRDEDAHRFALRGTALPESGPRLWYIRLGAERRMKRYGDAVATLEAMTQGQGAAVNDLQLTWLWGFLDEMKRAGAGEARRRAMKLLASDVYRPAETFGSNDEFRFAYVEELLAAGDSAAAGALVRSLEAPHNIAKASLDPRVRGQLPTADVRAAAEKMLVRHREWIAREPDRLRPLISAAENLRQLGRAAEALDLLRKAEARIDTLTAAEDSDFVNWWWNELARTYESLGRPDDAAQAYRKGMKTAEGGLPNVSQLINLALALNRFGRPKEALEALAVRDLAAGGASPYGIMLYRKARACALHLDGRGGLAAADLEFMKSHEKDAPGAVTDLFLCLGDVEAAAASVVRRLDDPEQRVDMLLELSDYENAPPPLPTDRIDANFEALKKRPDVQAAIARAGGTRRFNVAEL